MNDEDYMSGESERYLLELLRMFPPKDDRLAFGNSYWRICRGVWSLKGRHFSLEDLERTVNEDSTFREKQLSTKEISEVIEKLEHNLFFEAFKESSRLIRSEAADALKEFFGFDAKTGEGKIGFAKCLNKNEKRVMLWYCLHEPLGLSPKKAAKITGYLPEKCYKHLDRFARKGLLKRRSGRYFKDDENAIFQELLSEYRNYRFAESSNKEIIMIILRRYEKVSGKMIIKDLEEEGIKLDPKTVYNHMKALEEEGILAPEDKIKRRGTYEEFYTVNFGDSENYRKSLVSDIEKRMDRSGFHLSKNFSTHTKEQKLNAIVTFWEALQAGFLLRSTDQLSELPIWLDLLNELEKSRELNDAISEISKIPSGEKPDEKLRAISERYRLSTLVTSILYYSTHKCLQRDTKAPETRQ
jgi:DNA-binding transcriptional ArsR family regulator